MKYIDCLGCSVSRLFIAFIIACRRLISTGFVPLIGVDTAMISTCLYFAFVYRLRTCDIDCLDCSITKLFIAVIIVCGRAISIGLSHYLALILYRCR